MANRPKRRFDGIDGTETGPMGSGKGIEHQEFLSIFLQTGRGLGITESILVEDDVHGFLRIPFGRGLPDFV